MPRHQTLFSASDAKRCSAIFHEYRHHFIQHRYRASIARHSFASLPRVPFILTSRHYFSERHDDKRRCDGVGSLTAVSRSRNQGGS